MTIGMVVIKNDRAVIAADTLHTAGDLRVEKGNKIIKISENIFCCPSGYWSIRQSLMDFSKQQNDKPLSSILEIRRYFLDFKDYLIDNRIFNLNPGDTCPYSIEFDALMITPNGGYTISCDFVVIKITDFATIGSGDSHARGALGILYDQLEDPIDIVKKAIIIPSKFMNSCNNEYTIYSIDLEKVNKDDDNY